MPLYKHNSLNRKGKRVSGTIEAGSMQAAKDSVRTQDLMLINLAEVHEQSGTKTLASFFEKRVDHKSRILFTKQLGVLLKSGIPLLKSIELLVDQFEGRLRRILITVKDGLKGGKSLASCLEDYPKEFSNVYVQLIKAGEATGKLENILERLVDYLNRAEETRKKIRKAMAYPIFMITFAIAVTSGLVGFVLPNVIGAFLQTDTSLPWPTAFLLGLSEFVVENGMIILALLALGVTFFVYWRSTSKGKLLLDKATLRLPVISYFVKTKAVVQFCSTLGLLLDSGVNLAQALDIVTDIIDNSVLTISLKSARDKIIKEGKIAHYLKETGVFPSIASYMISTGEESGELASMLINVGSDYGSELSDLTDGLVAKINPIMILLIGGMIFFIVLAMFLPMLEMGEALGL